MILTEDTPIDDDGLWKLEQIVYSTHHYDRCRELCLKDPVHTIVLRDYFESQVIFVRMMLKVGSRKLTLAKLNVFLLFRFFLVGTNEKSVGRPFRNTEIDD